MNQMDPDEMAKNLDGSRAFRSSMARIGSSPDVTLDLVLQLMEIKAEGGDASGYRVHAKMAGGKSLTLFVVKEDGGYKVLDSSEKPNAIGLEALDRVNAGNLEGARVLLDWVRDDQHLEGGDDALAGLAFPRLWTKGKNADAAAMKLAAAAILVQTAPTAKEGVALLEGIEAQAREDAAKLNTELALAEGYEVSEQYDKLLPVSTELRKQHPESRRAFLMQSAALRGLGRYQEADQLAQDRMKSLPDDLDAMRALVRSAVGREDYGLAYKRAKQVLKVENSDASDKNQVAWYALFTGKVSGEDVEIALAAAQPDQNNANVLDTLGCVYAEVGRTKEAREVLVHAMDLGNLDEPNDAFWYAFGRVAEQYGETEVARVDYERVSKPRKTAPVSGSSYRLAQIRMKAIGKEKPSQTSIAVK